MLRVAIIWMHFNIAGLILGLGFSHHEKHKADLNFDFHFSTPFEFPIYENHFEAGKAALDGRCVKWEVTWFCIWDRAKI